MENNPQQENSFKERVLKSLEAENVKAYSKAHFTLRLILLIVIAILTLGVSVFLFNFVLFSLRVSGRGSLLNFGARGIFYFLQVFPWAFLFFDIALIVLLEWLVRKFRFGYRRPVLYLLFMLLALTISIAFLVDRTTGINDALLQQADRHQLPGPFGDMYENAKLPPSDRGICRCTITSINGNLITAEDIDVNTTTIIMIIVPGDYSELNSLKVGDVIFVAGTMATTGTIEAYGINAFPEP